jgi:hypothetical protein
MLLENVSLLAVAEVVVVAAGRGLPTTVRVKGIPTHARTT